MRPTRLGAMIAACVPRKQALALKMPNYSSSSCSWATLTRQRSRMLLNNASVALIPCCYFGVACWRDVNQNDARRLFLSRVAPAVTTKCVYALAWWAWR